MSLIALGWYRAGERLPAPLTAEENGPVAVVCAPEDICPSARDRLRLMQKVFDAGIDCVVLAAHQAWPLEQARQLAMNCSDHLSDQLAAIAGAGQLSVAVSWERPAPTLRTGISGRSWLKDLHARRMEQEALGDAARTALVTLIDGIAAPKTAILRVGSAGWVVSLLVRRNSLGHARDRIEQAGRRITGPDGIRVSVTGLWPALDFVSIPERMSEVST